MIRKHVVEGTVRWRVGVTLSCVPHPLPPPRQTLLAFFATAARWTKTPPFASRLFFRSGGADQENDFARLPRGQLTCRLQSSAGIQPGAIAPSQFRSPQSCRVVERTISPDKFFAIASGTGDDTVRRKKRHAP